MTDLRQAAQQALEALNKNSKHLPVDFDYHFNAIYALRQALAQPAEPVAWMFEHSETGRMNGGAGPVTATGKAIIEVVTAMLKERNA